MPKRSVGFVGLGKMGSVMTKRLVRFGHDVHGFSPGPTSRARAARAGVKVHASLAELVAALPRKKVVWLMVPSGAVVDRVLRDLLGLLGRGDIVVQGGNDFYRDTQRQSRLLARRGITMLDSGTSGGVAGLKTGFCLMIGGDRRAFTYVEPLVRSLAIKDGYGYFGPSGAGHFVKSVHNIIEYGYLEALAEGFQMLEDGAYRIDRDLAAQVWGHGSVIRSWLVDLARVAFSRPDFESLKPIITSQTTSELLRTARETGTPAPVFRAAIRARKDTRSRSAFARRTLNAIRREFGGHRVVT